MFALELVLGALLEIYFNCVIIILVCEANAKVIIYRLTYITIHVHEK